MAEEGVNVGLRISEHYAVNPVRLFRCEAVADICRRTPVKQLTNFYPPFLAMSTIIPPIAATITIARKCELYDIAARDRRIEFSFSVTIETI